jgi:starvation-inducible DNA-binding protein
MLDADVRTVASVPGLDWDVARKLTLRLNRDLATLTDLATAYKQAHWNVIGPGFTQLHLLFDRFADETHAYVDLVAERAVALGGVAHGTLQAAVDCSALTPFPVDERHEQRLLRELSVRVEHAAEELRESIGSGAEEPVAQAVYIEIARGIEKQLWMLRAQLPQHPPTTSGGE